MSETNANPALAHMDVAQDEIAIYATLLKRAQLSLTKSTQAFERANENLLTGNCPTRKQITQQIRQQYAALNNLTDAIVGTLDAPTFARMIATAPRRSPMLLALVELLPDSEKDLLNTAFSALVVLGRGEMEYLSAEQVELAQKILPLTYVEIET
ncbi:hypothetical protein [Aliterella atlantica]|uniref:Uncharacterized protein n=1 Tax=Aliterella atlantica CENA595 TaxID=1618023 RepID=A0A0D8ZN66_9CYAN|nr:hypothetical protein [Aliterella atlantica]KJH69792.1 hypothetical protein UH38_22035 [Aliterella atlantica CENA595]